MVELTRTRIGGARVPGEVMVSQDAGFIIWICVTVPVTLVDCVKSNSFSKSAFASCSLAAVFFGPWLADHSPTPLVETEEACIRRSGVTRRSANDRDLIADF